MLDDSYSPFSILQGVKSSVPRQVYTFNDQRQLTSMTTSNGDGSVNRSVEQVSWANRSAQFDASGTVKALDGTALTTDAQGLIAAQGPARFVADDDGMLLATLSPTAELFDGRSRFGGSDPGAVISLGDVVLGRDVAGTFVPTLDDARGSPRVTETGVIVRDAFGRTSGDLSPSASDFAGGVFMPQTGTVRMGMRDYDPTLGQFLSRDSIWSSALGPHAFTPADPVNYWDPSGRQFSGGDLTERADRPPPPPPTPPPPPPPPPPAAPSNIGSSDVALNPEPQQQVLPPQARSAALAAAHSFASAAFFVGGFLPVVGIPIALTGLAYSYYSGEISGAVALAGAVVTVGLGIFGLQAAGRAALAARGNRGLLRIADAAYDYGKVRTVAGYQLGGTAGLVGTTYNVNLWALYATEASQGLRALANGLRAEAAAVGAREISITGSAVINKGLLNINPAVAARFGLEFSRISETTILLRGLIR